MQHLKLFGLLHGKKIILKVPYACFENCMYNFEISEISDVGHSIFLNQIHICFVLSMGNRLCHKKEGTYHIDQNWNGSLIYDHTKSIMFKAINLNILRSQNKMQHAYYNGNKFWLKTIRRYSKRFYNPVRKH